MAKFCFSCGHLDTYLQVLRKVSRSRNQAHHRAATGEEEGKGMEAGGQKGLQLQQRCAGS